jgi:predicted dehydrogenase
MAEGKLNLEALITHRFPIEQACNAYELISGKTGEPSLGVLITYSEESAKSQPSRRLELVKSGAVQGESSIAIGLLGAGSFATGTLLPAMKKAMDARFIGVCAANGSHSRQAAEKFGFDYCSTDDQEIIADPSVNTIVVATRHHLHAAQVLSALQAGKHVFCEKPLCLTEAELSEIVRIYCNGRNPLLMVGFNRRFAPMAIKMKSFLDEIHEPLAMHYRINAGFIPSDHWVHDPEQGGGRIIGEVCHFVDFLTFLSGVPPIEVHARALANSGQYTDDNIVIALQYANGSQGTISYLANGDRSYSKERLEVFGGGAVAILDDFRRLDLIRHGRKQIGRSRFRQDKGHRGELEAFAQAIRSGGESPISFEDTLSATLSTFRIVDSLSSGHSVPVNLPDFIHSNA